MATDDIKETADAVGEAAGIIERGVEAVAEQIAELAATYGELAWETTLTIVRIDAAGDLLPSAVVVGATGYLLAKIALPGGWFWRGLAMEREAEEEKLYSDLGSKEHEAAKHKETVGFFQSLVSGLATIPLALSFLVNAFGLLNIWTWIALFAPELYLAKRALDAVVSL
jgi:hypothetical protein